MCSYSWGFHSCVHDCSHMAGIRFLEREKVKPVAAVRLDVGVSAAKLEIVGSFGMMLLQDSIKSFARIRAVQGICLRMRSR